MLCTYWTSVCNFVSAAQTSSLHVVLESSNEQHYADRSCLHHSYDTPGDAVGSDRSVSHFTD
jgi:hypothetical protein